MGIYIVNAMHTRATNIYSVYDMNDMNMVKNIRISDKAYEYLAKSVRYPESIADTVERLLGLKEIKNKK